MGKALVKDLHDDGVLDLFVFRSLGIGGGHTSLLRLVGQEGGRLPARWQIWHQVVVVGRGAFTLGGAVGSVFCICACLG